MVRNCAVCDGTEREILHSQEFYLPDGHPLAAGYDVVACEKCGFVYTDDADVDRSRCSQCGALNEAITF